MSQMIQISVSGDRALMRELSVAATKALPSNVVSDIFMKAIKPMLKTAKSLARRIPNKRSKRLKSGKESKTPTYSQLGKQLSVALTARKYKSRVRPGVYLGASQKKLQRFSRYTHHGRGGLPLAQMMELGTKERFKRKRSAAARFLSKKARGQSKRPTGRLTGGHPVWKAFKRKEKFTQSVTHRMMITALRSYGKQFSTVYFTSNPHGIAVPRQ